MSTVIASPSRYIQEKGALKNLASHVKALGDKLLVLITDSGKKRVGALIDEGANAEGIQVTYVSFNRECSDKEIQRVSDIAKEAGCNVICGVGGGKTLDTAKAAAYYLKAPVVICPTIASTDAPCSALSVIYTEDGQFEKYLFLPTSPSMVLVDTEIVAAAPYRLLASGMGDALATYFEARACYESKAQNCVGGLCSNAALTLAQLCYETLLAEGAKAMLAMSQKVCTKAVEDVIEANTYLSGIGFESGGLAAAHAIHNGFTVLPETHEFYHGEKVAFGTLVQLMLEDADRDEIEEVLEFCIEIGLPVTLADLGVNDTSKERIMEVAKTACAEGETIHNMPFKVTPEDVYAAIMAADAIGNYYLDEYEE